MVEEVKLNDKPDMPVPTTSRLIWTYLLYIFNFNFYLFGLLYYESFVLKTIFFLLLEGTISSLLLRSSAFSGFMLWTFIMGIVTLFNFGIFSLVSIFAIISMITNFYYARLLKKK